jgi:hypothetical protein
MRFHRPCRRTASGLAFAVSETGPGEAVARLRDRPPQSEMPAPRRCCRRPRETGAGVGRRDGLEELANRHGERAGEAHQYVSAGFRVRELDSTDVLVAQTRELGETFLRQLTLETQASHLASERAQGGRRMRLSDK